MNYRPNDMCRRKFFPQLIQRHGLEVGVEVGVLYGEFSQYLAPVLQKLYLVDSWLRPHKGRSPEEQQQIVRDGLQNYSNWEIVHLSSIDAATCFQDHSLDFVYLDAAHDYDSVMDDLAAWLPKLKLGGIMAGHDYNMSGVCRAVQSLSRPVCVLYGDRSESWWFYAGSDITG